MNHKYYITAAIPYVNAKPHIGHALEFVQTNVIARYHQQLGESVTSLSGSDENALKNVQAAQKSGQSIQQFIDTHNQEFQNLTKLLNAQFTTWQRGSDQSHHFTSSQKLWQLCDASGDIYKKSYKGLYCVGCELFYERNELDENGECFEHPGKPLEEVGEENYFFKLSKYQQPILDLINSGELSITPDTRKNEIVSFINRGLEDISISRSNDRAKNWGVPVPGDDKQRIYVWFDALNIYQSGIGFGWDDEKYNQLWPADVHVIGKGIIRFHAVYWPAFLLSAGLKTPKALFVHEYITVNGQKMSKTVGNVYDPVPLLNKHGADPLRYYLLSKISPFSDGDFSEEKFYASYNDDLANGLGNTVSRVSALAEKSGFDFTPDDPPGFRSEVKKHLNNYRFDFALSEIWTTLRNIDQAVEKEKPWELTGDSLKVFLTTQVAHLRQVAYELQPFLPETAEIIKTQFQGPKIKKTTPLFARIDQ